MTCIVGLVENEKIYMGGDSAGNAGYSQIRMASSKVFRNGDFLIGFVNSFRVGQLLRYKFIPPPHFDIKNIEKYMVINFVNQFKKCMEENFCEIQKGSGPIALIGFKNRLFRIESDFQIGENLMQFDAIGSGSPYALGVLYSIHCKPIYPFNKIKVALEASQHFNSQVREPFNYISSE